MKETEIVECDEVIQPSEISFGTAHSHIDGVLCFKVSVTFTENEKRQIILLSVEQTLDVVKYLLDQIGRLPNMKPN